MNVFSYFFELIRILFNSTDDYQIRGALLLLVLFGFVLGVVFCLIVSIIVKRFHH